MRWISTLPALAVALAPAIAAAQSSSCTVSASSLDFGTFGLLQAPVDSTGDVAVTCPSGTPYTVGLDGGTAGTDPSGRQLASGAHTIPYGLFKDSAHSQVWGQQGDSYGPVSGTGTGAVQHVTVYGRIPAQNGPVPGVYSDVITVTVTY